MDVAPLRESRDFRLLTVGEAITGLGTQAALVALPYQVYVITGSAFLTGLLGLAELVPLVAASLYAGALADRQDRRVLLMACQIALVAVSAGLAAATFAGTPPVWLLFLLAGAASGAASKWLTLRSPHHNSIGTTAVRWATRQTASTSSLEWNSSTPSIWPEKGSRR